MVQKHLDYDAIFIQFAAENKMTDYENANVYTIVAEMHNDNEFLAAMDLENAFADQLTELRVKYQ